jgi:hypothetical protein
VALFGRRDAEPLSAEADEKRLRAVRLAAEEELSRLRRELVERVAAVERKERELADAVASLRRSPDGELPPGTGEALSRARIGLSAHAQQLAERAAELDAREKDLAAKETDLARRIAADPAVQLATIEARLATLREAETAFARTQAELAARTEVLERREGELAERERTASGAPSGPTSGAMQELEERVERLEVETGDRTIEHSFGDGLRRMERKGLDGPSSG